MSNIYMGDTLIADLKERKLTKKEEKRAKEHAKDAESEDKYRDLVDQISSIIEDTDKITCPRKAGHIKYVKACLVYCDKVNKRIEKCEPLYNYIVKKLNMEKRIVNKAIDMINKSKEKDDTEKNGEINVSKK